MPIQRTERILMPQSVSLRNGMVPIQKMGGGGGTYFGGPDGDSGLWIQELSEWIKEHKDDGSINGWVSDLNNERKVFYEVNGELKCFIIHEGD